MPTEVMIRVNGADSGSIIVVPESCLAICDACGEDLYVHEWIAQDSQDMIYACDRV